MDIFLQSAVLVVTLLVLLGLGIWVGVALMASGVVIFLMFTSTPVDAILGTTMWAHSASWTLTALPLFIWMGEILYRTRLAEDLFSGLRQAYIPFEDVAARNTQNGFGVSRMSRGACETKVVATSDTHKIVTTFSTITGEVISDVLSELLGQVSY